MVGAPDFRITVLFEQVLTPWVNNWVLPTGVSLLVDLCCKTIQFYEINSAIKGYGQKMVNAVLKDLPKDWEVIIFMDWSDGFWDKMKEKFKDVKWVYI